MGRVEQGFGLLLILTILLDIFLTVLYARIGTGIIGSRVGRLFGIFLSKHQSLWARAEEPFYPSAARSSWCS
jgi:hypothetical protein